MGIGKRHNHVVPESYLRRFANENDLVATHLTNADRPDRAPVGRADVRVSGRSSRGRSS